MARIGRVKKVLPSAFVGCDKLIAFSVLNTYWSFNFCGKNRLIVSRIRF